jgi:hypothetical protein
MKPSGVAGKGWTIESGSLPRCSISWPGCFSPYIDSPGRVKFGSHDRDDISPQSIGESLCQHDDMSIDRHVRWRLWALV